MQERLSPFIQYPFGANIALVDALPFFPSNQFDLAKCCWSRKII